ncbi:hypothetical protein [Williamsia sterculiae]|uniref:Uncharacterized protein n=1 Tax=Williamsia sterculiae TaxID=1344003 RepID=A0A1N7DVF2_9NOCA|nr:hypothetical protein [Williamsia sterculiae]SIR79751.1 hypothetical protein SAMN05445060_0933 [Williamsia sterculiae]
MSEQTPAAPRRVSPVMAVVGLVAVLVAVWGLLGGPSLGDLDIARWIAVAIAVGIGVTLILTGSRSRR